jgi:exodeoxyribonuclease VII small subunit
MSSPPPQELSFEQALAELERIVRVLEDGQTSLEEALSRYEAGVGLLKKCYSQLGTAEQRIVMLTGTDDAGKPVTRVFDHAAAVEAEKALRAAAPVKAVAAPVPSTAPPRQAPAPRPAASPRPVEKSAEELF